MFKFKIKDSGTIHVSNVYAYMPQDSFYDKLDLFINQFPMIKFQLFAHEDNLYIIFDDVDEDFAEEIQSWMDENLNKD